MDDSPALSVSQEAPGVVDTGEESFSVDSTPAPVQGKTGESEEKPGEEKPGEEKPGEKPAQETAPALEEGGEKEEPAAEELPAEELPKGVKKRLATVTRKRHEAERETMAVRAENRELLTRLEKLEHPGTEPGQEPQIDDFDTEEEYLEAVGEYKADLKVAERDIAQREAWEKEAQGKQEEDAQVRQENFQTKLKEGIEKHEDFEDVIEDLNITGDMIHILESLPNISDVVYELGNNPKAVADLVEMPFLQAAYRMKAISDGLAKKKTTKAPAPIVPVSTTGGLMKGLEQMSQAEYNLYMDKRDSERKGIHV